MFASHAVEHLADPFELSIDLTGRVGGDKPKPPGELELRVNLGRRSDSDAQEIQSERHCAAALPFRNVGRNGDR
jgi:hypothetical protein